MAPASNRRWAPASLSNTPGPGSASSSRGKLIARGIIRCSNNRAGTWRERRRSWYAVLMNRPCRFISSLILAALTLTLAQAPLTAQNRMSDKDLERLMTNMYDDAKKFRSSFNSSISKSTIRKTAQEKQSKTLVEQFIKDISDMRNEFKKKKVVALTFPKVQSAAVQIDDLLQSVHLDAQTNDAWAKVRAEFQQVSGAFNIPSA